MLPAIGFPIVGVIRTLAALIAADVLIWCIHFRGGLALSSPDNNFLLIFNVHPVLMVIGFLLIQGEAILAYKTLSGTKNFKKFVHLTLQLVALILGLIGTWAAYKFHNERGIDNFYSLHSLAWPVLPLSICHSVGCWICYLLVPWWIQKQSGICADMACFYWRIHLCVGDCNLNNWTFRKGNFYAECKDDISLRY